MAPPLLLTQNSSASNIRSGSSSCAIRAAASVNWPVPSSVPTQLITAVLTPRISRNSKVTRTGRGRVCRMAALTSRFNSARRYSLSCISDTSLFSQFASA